MKRLIKKSQLEFKGAPGGQGGKPNMCHLNSRECYFKFKEQGKDVKYMEGQAYAVMEDGQPKWIDHAWLLVDGAVYDPSWGSNEDTLYKGNVIKDEYMTKIPEWMTWADEEDDYKDINIRVSNEFPNSIE